MNDRRDPRSRRLSRRAILRGASAVAVGPVIAGCTLLDALEDERFTVEINDRARFEPGGITIPVGGTVVWRNEDTYRHTVTTDEAVLDDPNRVVVPDGAGTFDSGDIPAGRQWTHTFDVPGTYVYACRHHQTEGMVGTVIVEAEES